MRKKKQKQSLAVRVVSAAIVGLLILVLVVTAVVPY